jgi:hypothetical protein
MAATAWAVEYFHTFLKGVHFTVFLDHKPLEALNTRHSKTLTRLEEQLMTYNFTLVYRKGEDNAPANALSRNVAKATSFIEAKWPSGPLDDPQEINAISEQSDFKAVSWSNADIRAMQHTCDLCKAIKAKLEASQCEASAAAKKQANMLADACIIEHGIIKYVWKRKGFESRPLAIMPQHARQDVLAAAHANPMSGHGGTFQTAQCILRQCWWPGITAAVDDFVRACTPCQ